MVERYFRLSNGQVELLKWVALVLMVVNHVGMFFDFNSFRYIGRVVYPIFAFLAAYNYMHNTRNKMEYIKRICRWAMIAQVPFSLFVSTKTSSFNLNILFSLSIGLLIIYLIFDSQKPWRWTAITMLVFLSIFVSYGVMGVLLVIASYILLNVKPNRNLKATGEDLMVSVMNYRWWASLTLLVVVLAALNHPKYLVATLMSVIIVYLVSRSRVKMKRTKGSFFYAFYPAHITIIGMVAFSFGAH